MDIFISHASGTSFAIPKLLIRDFCSVWEVKRAVRVYLIDPSRRSVERCLAACRLLDNLSDEDWDALEPLLVKEIKVLSGPVPAWFRRAP